MSHLTPQVRVNKNGVSVIKHVNLEGKSSSKRASLPSVAASSREKKAATALVGHIREALDRDMHGINVSVSRPELYKRAKTLLSASTVDAYLKAIDEEPDFGYAELLIGLLEDSHDDKTAAYALVITGMDPRAKDYEPTDKGFYLLDLAIAVHDGLHDYGDAYTPAEDILDPDDVESERTRAVLRVTIDLVNSGATIANSYVLGGVYAVKINDPDLLRLVLDRPQDAEAISSSLMDNRRRTTAEIEAMLDGVHPALLNGAI